MAKIEKKMLLCFGHVERTGVSRLSAQNYRANVNGNVGKVDLGVLCLIREDVSK